VSRPTARALLATQTFARSTKDLPVPGHDDRDAAVALASPDSVAFANPLKPEALNPSFSE